MATELEPQQQDIPKPEQQEQQPSPPERDAGMEESLSSRPKAQIALIMSSFCACVFVAALDVTIIATALPAIAATFHSASGYQWVGSAYVLGNTASTPTWGKISDIWGRKMILLCAIALFFVGSLMCALGNNMPVFLSGRAVQGVGGAGLLTLVNIAISDLFSMRDRGLYYGLTSVVWAVASGVGPVLGGVFTQQASWRWCFWINLPITVACFAFLLFTMPKDHPGTPIWVGLKAIDWTGSLLIVGGTLMLLLGLNFGGLTFPWASATVINLIVFGVFTCFLFVLNEWKLVRYPVMPPRLFHNRSSIGSFTVVFFHGAVLLGVAYYLPLYFQAVLGAGPLLSGVYLLPFVIPNTVCAAGTGLFIQRTGKYMPAIYVGLVVMVVGIGLFVDLEAKANWAKLITYQILVGAGVGMNFEGPLLALQASNDVQDVATATATVGFVRMLASAISAVVGGVVFQNQMVKEAADLTLTLGSEVANRVAGGEASANVEAIRTLPPDQRVLVRGAFHRSLRTMWIMV
jgi:EmrB/QacA subfamily drug resistance transporter